MSDDRDRRSRNGDYTMARVAAAMALVGVVVFMLVVDALSPDYEASPLIVTSVLGAAGALLGVEILDFVRRVRYEEPDHRKPREEENLP